MADTSPPRTALKTVVVIIPTFRRPEGLATAMTSIASQTGLGGVSIELIVCDNSPEASARPQVEAFALSASFPVRFLHEPKTGVANARNTAVRGCDAQFIAFLDDDEDAPPVWLSRLLAAQADLDADVVFGPVEARVPEATGRFRPYYTSFFSRFGPASSQRLEMHYGCGNSLLRADRLDAEPFATTQNEMGGEDDLLFTELRRRGCVMAWAADAPVWEDVPPRRATLNYTLRRGFAYGQGPSHLAGTGGRPLACAAWMIQGIGQAVVFAVLAAAAWIVQSPRSAFLIDKAARGLGKVFWFPPFKMKFYGQALLKKKDKTSA